MAHLHPYRDTSKGFSSRIYIGQWGYKLKLNFLSYLDRILGKIITDA
jgi:hypothetical protein